MSFYIVDRALSTVKSKQLAPLSFSISGNYLVEIPDNIGIIEPTNQVITAPGGLIERKIEGFRFFHPTLLKDEYDEIISSPNVDLAESSGVIVGPQKRTGLLPNGVLVTNPIAFDAMGTIFANWYGFTLTNVTSASGPDRILYNHDSNGTNYVPFDTSTFTVELRNSANSATLHSFAYQQEQPLSLGAGNYRLRFINGSSSVTYYLSDWLILYI